MELRSQSLPNNVSLHEAVLHSNKNVVEDLIKRNMDLNALNLQGETALHNAACFGDKEVVQSLLDNKANPNVQDLKGQTALHKSARWGNIDSTKLLLDSKANPNIQDNDYTTPLHVAIYTFIHRMRVLSKYEPLTIPIRQPAYNPITDQYKNIVKLLLSLNNIDLSLADKEHKTGIDLIKKYNSIIRQEKDSYIAQNKSLSSKSSKEFKHLVQAIADIHKHPFAEELIEPEFLEPNDLY